MATCNFQPPGPALRVRGDRRGRGGRLWRRAQTQLIFRKESEATVAVGTVHPAGGTRRSEEEARGVPAAGKAPRASGAESESGRCRGWVFEPLPRPDPAERRAGSEGRKGGCPRRGAPGRPGTAESPRGAAARGPRSRRGVRVRPAHRCARRSPS